MPFLKKINIFSDYKKYNLPLFEYPPFIFFVLGCFIVAAILIAYYVGNRYLEPEQLSLVVMGIAVILLVLNYIIVNSFQNLAEANLLKSEFMNIVSHELKTPLTNLKWTIDLAISEGCEGKNKEYFEVIRTQNERMLKLINNMLMASRIEQKRWSPKEEKVDLKEVVEKVIKKLDPLIKSSNVKIEFSSKKVPKIITDPQAVEQVIENLLDNAVGYSKGSDIVKIFLEKDKKMIKFSVLDKGVGIPKEEQKKIFGKFFRSSNIFRYQTKGLGLSLFIVKAIINELKGKVGFTSKENKGSTFWFLLPLK